MKFTRGKKGFTLVEMLIASTLFALIGTITLTIFVTSTRSRSGFNARELLYDDTQFVMSQLERDIANNAIDYEEYYNQIVLGGDYGTNFGYYGTEFYYNPEEDRHGKNGNCHLEETNCVNLGQNPADEEEKNASNANAFMEIFSNSKKNIFCTDYNIDIVLKSISSTKNYVCVKDLYLISPPANKKTLIITDGTKNSWNIKKFEMIQSSTKGIFTCPGSGIYKECGISKDVTIINNKKSKDAETKTEKIIIKIPDKSVNFISIIPNRLNIRDIRFYISPIEDTFKAYSEFTISQPAINIYLEVSPTGKDSPILKLEKKVTPSVFEEIKSYPPRMELLTPQSP